MSADRSPRVAALLSAALPGLGQFYNRQWAKGAGFLLATLIIDAGLSVTSETVSVLQSVFVAGQATQVKAGGLVLRMLPLAALALWSITDAARTTKAFPRSSQLR